MIGWGILKLFVESSDPGFGAEPASWLSAVPAAASPTPPAPRPGLSLRPSGSPAHFAPDECPSHKHDIAVQLYLLQELMHAIPNGLHRLASTGNPEAPLGPGNSAGAGQSTRT